MVLCFTSIYSISAWCILLSGTIYGGTRIITTHSFAPDLQLSLIEKYGVTYAHNPPFQLALMLKSDRLDRTDLSSLKYQSTSGAKIPIHIKNEIISKMKIQTFYTIYGLSESSGIVSISLSVDDSSDSVGQLMSFCTIKIIDEEGNRLGPDENGEVCFKTNYRFLGYYGNEKATAASFDEEGFFLTGDIGHFDDNGNLYIVDRKKDLIKYNNYQVSPSEIESYLIESLKIKVVCVVGIRDEMANELPTAFIIRMPGSNITEKHVFDTVAGIF